jgi:hypothetical protein
MKRIIQLFSLVVLASGMAASAWAGNITVKGSDTLLILAQKWAETYMGQQPDVKIQVSGGGTGTGFAALQNQTTDLCDASRRAKSPEIANCIKAFGKRPTEYKVALDGLSVYVNGENPVKELTIDQLGGIFTGKIKNWKSVVPTRPSPFTAAKTVPAPMSSSKEKFSKARTSRPVRRPCPAQRPFCRRSAKIKVASAMAVPVTVREPSILPSKKMILPRPSNQVRKTWKIEVIPSGATSMCM